MCSDKVELKEYLGDEAVENFLRIIEDKNDIDKFVDNLTKMRNTYEQILRECSKRIPDMKGYCFNERGNIDLGYNTINGLKGDGHINMIREKFFFSLKSITSDYGSHRKLIGDKPTIEAINALTYQLKDMILWFGDICNKYQK